MTGRIAARFVSICLAAACVGCLSYYEITIETPIRAKLDVSTFNRVLIPGFVAGGSKAIEPNAETARLLRSQIRRSSDMRLIDADVVSLVAEVDKRNGVPPPPRTAGGAAPESRIIKDERELAPYEGILKDAEYWKKIGDEYGGPLIITGSIFFAEITRSGMVPRVRTFTDQMGRQQVEEIREFANLRGYALTPRFVFIDGRTGAVLHTETYYEEALYAESQNSPALSSYFEMMDRLMPAVLGQLSTQWIRGTRTLLIK
jgi:hypothetical protein